MSEHLIVKQAKAAARRAYKARKLTAQYRNPNKRKCVYHDGSCYCAIGAGLSPKTLQVIEIRRLNELTSVRNLEREGVITTDNIEGLARLQTRHDAWCQADSSDRTRRRKEFLEYIEYIS
jgi:hypothetical protein